MENFKTKTRLQNGCEVTARTKGRECVLNIRGPTDIMLNDSRIYINQLNGRGRGKYDILGLGKLSGKYNVPGGIRIIKFESEVWEKSTSLYTGEAVMEKSDYQKFLNSKEKKCANVSPMRTIFISDWTITVWTDERDGKEISFYLKVTQQNLSDDVNIRIYKEALLKREAEVLSLKGDIIELKRNVIPDFVNKPARKALLETLANEHVTSLDVEFFSSYLANKNGAKVSLPARMSKMVERNVPKTGRPPLSAEAQTFLPSGATVSLDTDKVRRAVVMINEINRNAKSKYGMDMRPSQAYQVRKKFLTEELSRLMAIKTQQGQEKYRTLVELIGESLT